MSGSVIVAGARTPIGRLLGGLKDRLGRRPRRRRHQGRAGEGRGRRRPGRLRDHGPGPPGRRRARSPPARPRVKAGIPMTRPLDHHQQGVPVRHQRDRPGRPADPGRRGRDRRGRRHGVDDQRPVPAAEVPRGLSSTATSTLVDSMAYDGALRPFDRRSRWAPAPRRATQRRPASTREEQDEFAARSPPAGRRGHGRTACFDDEIVPVEIPQRKGDPVVVSDDEGVRADTTAESLGRLRPAFDKDGTITAGNASQISDGACAVVVMSKAKAEELGARPARRDRRLRPGRRSRLRRC